VRRPPALVAAGSTAVLLLVGACTANSTGSDSDTGSDSAISVSADDDSCTLSTDSAPSGKVVFSVTNEGNEVTEFYLYREDGKTIAGEVENIGPGLSRQLSLDADPGAYVAACKPGMKGDGIRADFTVTD
jgi:iron uptake system component EfeO